MGRFHVTDEQQRALNAYIKLLRATQSINAPLFRALQKKYSLTPGQFGVLEALLSVLS